MSSAFVWRFQSPKVDARAADGATHKWHLDLRRRHIRQAWLTLLLLASFSGSFSGDRGSEGGTVGGGGCMSMLSTKKATKMESQRPTRQQK